MNRNLKRIISSLLTLLILTSLMAVCVSASQIDLKKRCSLNLRMMVPNEKGDSVPAEGKVGLYQVALARQRGEKQVFVPTASFAAADMDLRDVENQEDFNKKVSAEKLQEHIEKYHLRPRYIAEVEEDGMAHFKNLPAGLYLAAPVESGNAAACFSMNPFMISLPRFDKQGKVDYDCDEPMIPKVEVARNLIDIEVIKKWAEDKAEDRPKSITVELLNEDGQVAESKVLTKENGWTCSFLDKPADVKWEIQEKDVDGYKTSIGQMTYKKDHYEVVIINTRDPEKPLAQTGQLNWPVPFLVIGGVLFCTAGYVVSHEKKKSEQ